MANTRMDSGRWYGDVSDCVISNGAGRMLNSKSLQQGVPLVALPQLSLVLGRQSSFCENWPWS